MTYLLTSREGVVHSDGRRDVDLMKGTPAKEVTTVLRFEEVSKVALVEREMEEEGAFPSLLSSRHEGRHPFPTGGPVTYVDGQ